eukprot:scaffold216717_cov15-Tisochrysis_lutea.AAC.1
MPRAAASALAAQRADSSHQHQTKNSPSEKQGSMGPGAARDGEDNAARKMDTSEKVFGGGKQGRATTHIKASSGHTGRDLHLDTPQVSSSHTHTPGLLSQQPLQAHAQPAPGLANHSSSVLQKHQWQQPLRQRQQSAPLTLGRLLASQLSLPTAAQHAGSAEGQQAEGGMRAGDGWQELQHVRVDDGFVASKPLQHCRSSLTTQQAKQYTGLCSTSQSHSTASIHNSVARLARQVCVAGIAIWEDYARKQGWWTHFPCRMGACLFTPAYPF